MFGVQLEQIDLESESQIKQAVIIMNGNPDKTFILQFKHHLTLMQIQKTVQLKWNIKYKILRIFNLEGVEFYNEDLKYLKNNQTLYISKGQQFDANSSFGQYQIIKNLGQGGFGTVSLGKHKNTDQLVAIKIMKANKIDSAHEIDLVFRQVENLKALNHPNIVKIFNSYTLKQMQVIIIMEYLEGGQLLDLLKVKQKFQEEEARVIFKQIVNAISYCHSKNIIHRDLKLQNILLKRIGTTEVKIVDFGISGVADIFNPDVDTGTLKYMSPEVLSGKQKGNSTSIDIWSIGCILYAMLYGKLPFNGASSNQIIKAIIQGNIKFHKEIEISREAKYLIKRLLDPNAKLRIKMNEIKQDNWYRGIKSEQQCNQLSILEENKQKLPEIKKQKTTQRIYNKYQIQRKKLKQSTVIQFPKRLEKEKDFIQNELRQYEKNRQKFVKRGSIKSETKNFNSKNQQIILIKQKSVLLPNANPISMNYWLKSKQGSPKIIKKMI